MTVKFVTVIKKCNFVIVTKEKKVTQLPIKLPRK